MLPEKIEWLKSNGLWNDLLDYYIEKKNNNLNPDKHSRAIFAESIAEMCQKMVTIINAKGDGFLRRPFLCLLRINS